MAPTFTPKPFRRAIPLAKRTSASPNVGFRSKRTKRQSCALATRCRLLQNAHMPIVKDKSLVQWNSLQTAIVGCERCPRLRKHCITIGQVRRAAYRDQTYWSRPVPNFGDPSARLLIFGLAPGAHGANRTGRMFTGDKSGEFLYRALYQNRFASQAESRSR